MIETLPPFAILHHAEEGEDGVIISSSDRRVTVTPARVAVCATAMTWCR
jgi:hypothetical protein